MKRMMHSQHGYAHAYNALEEQSMRENGWVDDDGQALAEKLKSLGLDEQAEEVVTSRKSRKEQ